MINFEVASCARFWDIPAKIILWRRRRRRRRRTSTMALNENAFAFHLIKAKACQALSHSLALIHSRFNTTGTHMSFGSTQFYLPPDKGDAPDIAQPKLVQCRRLLIRRQISHVQSVSGAILTCFAWPYHMVGFFFDFFSAGSIVVVIALIRKLVLASYGKNIS